MFRNYLSIAWRNLAKNKVPSFLNIAGLATGLAVAILIGLWAWDELTYNHYHNNHSRIAQVMQHQTFGGITKTGPAIPLPLKPVLEKSYSDDFKYLVMASWTWDHIVSVNNKHLTRDGIYMDEQAPEMLQLHMIAGNHQGLHDRSSILLAQSTAKALFDNREAMGQTIKLDNNLLLKVTGIYEDLPYNTTFENLAFIATWEAYVQSEPWIQRSATDWGNNSFQLFAQIADGADMDKVSAHIKNAKIKHLNKEEAAFKPQIVLHGMDKWHLYDEFKNGVNIGGRIQFVWLFCIIGAFVLLLACINFMNLSTARSEKRAREIGIRKAIGSLRSQLIVQFLSESLLVTLLALIMALLLVVLALPQFNQVADKRIQLPWTNGLFWLILIATTCLTSLIAGSYPALYLSSFQPVKILKGVFKAGRFAAVPRKALVIVQFTVSVILITGTIVVFKQIQYAKNIPTGYTQAGLISFSMPSAELWPHLQALNNDLVKSGAVVATANSNSPVTSLNSNTSSISWPGKPPGFTADFGVIRVSHDYGKAIGWQFKEGRDFNLQMATDSNNVVINEAAVSYMGLQKPVIGKVIDWRGKKSTIIGVIANMVVSSPFTPVKQSIYCIDDEPGSYLNIKLNSAMPLRQAISTTESIIKQYAPDMPFIYEFADEAYAKKFGSEERVGTLAGFFAILAVFISCLGLFGMAAFMAEQRIKEIGVRKVLGASVFQLWHLLSKDFMALTLIALVIATPIAWYGMHTWLGNYHYHTSISWWIFAASGLAALLLTLVTVSFQSVKAALSNPVKSLKTE